MSEGGEDEGVDGEEDGEEREEAEDSNEERGVVGRTERRRRRSGVGWFGRGGFVVERELGVVAVVDIFDEEIRRMTRLFHSLAGR